MNSNGSILAKLLLRFVYLTNKVNKTLAGLRHTLLRPVSKVELSNGSRLSILYIEHHLLVLSEPAAYIIIIISSSSHTDVLAIFF